MRTTCHSPKTVSITASSIVGNRTRPSGVKRLAEQLTSMQPLILPHPTSTHSWTSLSKPKANNPFSPTGPNLPQRRSNKTTPPHRRRSENDDEQGIPVVSPISVHCSVTVPPRPPDVPHVARGSSRVTLVRYGRVLIECLCVSDESKHPHNGYGARIG